eukprot:TRINITY_DN11545_c0_g1_i2.p1 TRINITY_DN11545_c0_g1~~TRINITY_DN11545_c0_g1_i2.p1  ORF type:complete len:178 (-),score=20.84 TRINITY_DN11545_c0_g1_i2:228-761(-)
MSCVCAHHRHYHQVTRSPVEIFSDPGSPRDGAESISSMPSSAGLSDRETQMYQPPPNLTNLPNAYSFSAAYAGHSVPHSGEYPDTTMSFHSSEITYSSASSSEGLASPRHHLNSRPVGSVFNMSRSQATPGQSQASIPPISDHASSRSQTQSQASSISNQEFRMRYYMALSRDSKKK